MHLLGKVEDLVRGLLMHPVVKRAIKVIAAVCRDLLRELSLEAGEHVIELESVCRKVNPLGGSSKECKSVAWPETV